MINHTSTLFSSEEELSNKQFRARIVGCLASNVVYPGLNPSVLFSLNHRRSEKRAHFQHVSEPGYFHMSAMISTATRSSSDPPIPVGVSIPLGRALHEHLT